MYFLCKEKCCMKHGSHKVPSLKPRGKGVVLVKIKIHKFDQVCKTNINNLQNKIINYS
jgi:hypothetical protein